jgi:hypothetical protein
MRRNSRHRAQRISISCNEGPDWTIALAITRSPSALLLLQTDACARTHARTLYVPSTSCSPNHLYSYSHEHTRTRDTLQILRIHAPNQRRESRAIRPSAPQHALDRDSSSARAGQALNRPRSVVCVRGWTRDQDRNATQKCMSRYLQCTATMCARLDMTRRSMCDQRRWMADVMRLYVLRHSTLAPLLWCALALAAIRLLRLLVECER